MKVAVILAAVVCCVYATAIPKETPEVKEIIQERSQEWLRQFYDNCGRTWNIEESVLAGLYRGDEIVKRCIGDRDGCIEKEDCWFAVAVEETATYDGRWRTTTTTTPTPSPTTTATTTTAGPTSPTTTLPTHPPFTRWDRRTKQVKIDILDTCHLEPIDFEHRNQTNKFVGVALGIFDSEGKLACDLNPWGVSGFGTGFKFENVRAYFAVENISKCQFQTNLPVHPIDHHLQNTDKVETDRIRNTITLTADDWNGPDGEGGICGPSEPPSIFRRSLVNFTLNSAVSESEYMSHFLIHYYGTEDYTRRSDTGEDPNFAFMDGADFETLGMLRIMPKNRTMPGDDGDDKGGSTSVQAHLILSLAAVIPIIKSFL